MSESNGSATTFKTKGRKATSTVDHEDRDEREQLAVQKMEEAAKKPTASKIVLPELKIQTMHVKLVGDSPLIVHKWSEKAKKQILDKQMGNPTDGKAPKNPQEDYESTIYYLPDGSYGFPAIAFKQAAVTACTSLGKAITKVTARQAFHVDPIDKGLVRIDGKPTMREDMVKIGMDTADIRFRAEFAEWSTVLPVRFNSNVLTAAQIVNLFRYAGFAVGVGEWRVEKDGMMGLFHVAGAGE